MIVWELPDITGGEITGYTVRIYYEVNGERTTVTYEISNSKPNWLAPAALPAHRPLPSHEDGERFSVVMSLAHSCLPNETASINRRVASIEHEWQTEEDVSLSSKLISQNGPATTG